MANPTEFERLLELEDAANVGAGTGRFDYSDAARSAPKDLFVFLGDDAVGIFSLGARDFRFRYLQANLDRSRPIVIPDFPDTGKAYASPVPFPFLEVRLPSPKRPSVREEIKREKLTSLYDLLVFYGRHSATSPFDLLPRDEVEGDTEHARRKSTLSPKPTV